jgi:hypothetical protein
MEDKKYEALLARLGRAEKNAQIARDWVEIANLHGRYNHLCLGGAVLALLTVRRTQIQLKG